MFKDLEKEEKKDILKEKVTELIDKFKEIKAQNEELKAENEALKMQLTKIEDDTSAKSLSEDELLRQIDAVLLD